MPSGGEHDKVDNAASVGSVEQQQIIRPENHCSVMKEHEIM
jgi:hypothetical protein